MGLMGAWLYQRVYGYFDLLGSESKDWLYRGTLRICKINM